MTFAFGSRSLKRLEGVHPHLVRVMQRAIGMAERDFTVLEGLRTLARQKQLVRAGASQTIRSRHITGHAVDVAPIAAGVVRWDWPLFYPLAETIKEAARLEDVPIEWGGDWKMKDGPHWQLPWRDYP